MFIIVEIIFKMLIKSFKIIKNKKKNLIKNFIVNYTSEESGEYFLVPKILFIKLKKFSIAINVFELEFSY